MGFLLLREAVGVAVGVNSSQHGFQDLGSPCLGLRDVLWVSVGLKRVNDSLPISGP